MNTILYNNKNLFYVIATYENNDRIAILMHEEPTGEFYDDLTTNIEEFNLDNNEIAINCFKSGRKEIAAKLEQKGILSPVLRMESAFSNYQIRKLLISTT